MVIRQGSEGCICGFYNGKMICSAPLSKKRTYEKYGKECDIIILQGLQKYNYKEIIVIFLDVLNYYKSVSKDFIPCDKQDYLIIGILILCRLKVVNVDDDNQGILICPRKKFKKHKRHNVRKKRGKGNIVFDD
jgi:hypothetical protein